MEKDFRCSVFYSQEKLHSDSRKRAMMVIRLLSFLYINPKGVNHGQCRAKQAEYTSSAIGPSQILLGVAIIIVASLATWLTVLAIGFMLGIRGVLDLYRGIKNQHSGLSRNIGRIVTGWGYYWELK